MPHEPRIRISLSEHNPELASALQAALGPDATVSGQVRFKGGPAELIILVHAAAHLITHATALALALKALLSTVSKVLGRRKRQVWIEHKDSTFVIRMRGDKKTVELPSGKRKTFRSAAELARLIGAREKPKRKAKKR